MNKFFETGIIKEADWRANIARQADRLIRAGKMKVTDVADYFLQRFSRTFPRYVRRANYKANAARNAAVNNIATTEAANANNLNPYQQAYAKKLHDHTLRAGDEALSHANKAADSVLNDAMSLYGLNTSKRFNKFILNGGNLTDVLAKPELANNFFTRTFNPKATQIADRFAYVSNNAVHTPTKFDNATKAYKNAHSNSPTLWFGNETKMP